MLLQLPIGAESVGIGADDLVELEEDEDEYLRLGQENEHEADFSKLQLKPDHHNRHVCKAVSILNHLHHVIAHPAIYCTKEAEISA